MKMLSALIALGLLAACSSTPSRTLLALSQFDLLSADYAQMGARIEHPSGIEIRPGGALVSLRASHEGGALLSRTIPLSATTQASGEEPDRTVTDFVIAPAEIAEIESFRAQAEAWKADGHKVSGSVSVSVQGCKSGALPEGPLLASILLKLSDETGYLPFREGLDLRELAEAHQGAGSVDNCGNS